jgi:hypothetical protein
VFCIAQVYTMALRGAPARAGRRALMRQENRFIGIG